MEWQAKRPMRLCFGDVEPGMPQEPNRPLVACIDVVHQLRKSLPHAGNVRTRQPNKRTLLLVNKVCPEHPRHTQSIEQVGRHDTQHCHQPAILIDGRPAVERAINACMNACKHVGRPGGRLYLVAVGLAQVVRQVLGVTRAGLDQINLLRHLIPFTINALRLG